MVLVTVKLNNGRFVLGRLRQGAPESFKYSNKTQADRRAQEVGGAVAQFGGRTFYVEMDHVDERVGAQPNTRRASVLGTCAFFMGVCAPVLDPVLRATQRGRLVEDPRTIPELKAWTDAWTRANLAAPVP